MEVIRKNVSCAFTASQVCVTVVGFGFTLRQTSSLYGYGNREKRPTVARGPGEYSSMATSVILESTWCNYPVAGTQRSRPLPSSTLEPKAPLFIRGGRPKKRGMTNPPHRPIQNFAWRINRAVYRYPLTGNITGGLVCAERTQQRRNQTDQAPPRQCAPKHAAPFRVPLHRLKRVHMTPRGPCAHGSEQLKQSARNHVDTTSFRRVYLT